MQLTMSEKERDRLKTMAQLKAGKLTQSEAAHMMGLSVRHVRRLAKLYAESGDAGLVHKGRGRPSNRKLPLETAARIKEALEVAYKGVGPTLAAEKLCEREGIEVSRETVRGICKTIPGLKVWERKAQPHRRRRPRRPCFGDLLQIDSSPHDWLEGRGPRLTLVTIIDDATGRKLLLFAMEDSGAANREAILRWIRAYGRPRAFYADRATHFFPLEVAGHRPAPTQIQRALEALGIELIAARSPQAKGRVERSHGTDQKRLVLDLRLAGACTLEEANAVLEGYTKAINAKFEVLPESPADAHRPIEGFDLESILSHQENRTVANDWTIQFEGQTWQLDGASVTGMRPRTRVIVEKRLDGQVCVRWGSRYLNYRLAPSPPHKAAMAAESDDDDEPLGAGSGRRDAGRRGFAPPTRIPPT